MLTKGTESQRSYQTKDSGRVLKVEAIKSVNEGVSDYFDKKLNLDIYGAKYERLKHKYRHFDDLRLKAEDRRNRKYDVDDVQHCFDIDQLNRKRRKHSEL